MRAKRMLIGILMMLFGGLALWGAFQISGAVRRARGWPTVEGRVLERGVSEPRASPRGRSFLPVAKYSYAVAGKSFTNDQVYAIRGTVGAKDDMQKVVDGLPDPVPVHYNPADPSESYLLLNSLGTYWLLLIFGIGALLIGSMVLLAGVMAAKGNG